MQLFDLLGSVPLVGDEDKPPTSECSDDEEDEADFFGLPVSRRDGAAMCDQDDSALLEFGGLARLLIALTTTPLVGDLEASPFETDSADAPSTPSNNGNPADPFADVERRDGLSFDIEDENALLPYLALGVVAEWLLPGDGGGSSLGPLFPEADEELTALGEAWGAVQAAKERDWGVLDNAIDNDEALLHYSAWAKAGSLLLAVYRKTVGGLDVLANSDSSGSKGEKAAAPEAATLKRKPSGAELSAWIGKATHASLGLANPQRKVRARGLI